MAEPELDPGQEKVWGNPFSCTNGVANGFSTSSDFSADEFNRWCDSGYQKQEILQKATHGGDVSIFRSFDARPNQKYRIEATCKINGASGDFRARAKIAAWGGGSQLDEWIVDLTDKDGPFVVIIRESTLTPSNTSNIRANFRAHAHMSGEPYGVAVLKELRFKRLQ